MKTCYSCKIEKDESCFNWKNKARGILQGYCRDCKKTHQKKYYLSSKKSYLATIMRTRKVRREDAKGKAREYLLQHPCVDCGNADIRVLHFDHVRDKKHTEVTKMIQKGSSWQQIEKEIGKCEIRCANCHMIKTWPTRWESALSSNLV